MFSATSAPRSISDFVGSAANRREHGAGLPTRDHGAWGDHTWRDGKRGDHGDVAFVDIKADVGIAGKVPAAVRKQGSNGPEHVAGLPDRDDVA